LWLGDSEDLKYPSGVDTTLAIVLERCKLLQTLEIMFPGRCRSTITTSVTKHLRPHDHLKQLTLESVVLSVELLRTLAQMPCLEDLSCHTGSSWGKLPNDSSVTGFLNLRFFNIWDRSTNIVAFLRSFGESNLLEELELSKAAVLEPPDSAILFPETFVGRHITRLCVSSKIGACIASNVLENCAKFDQLQRLTLKGEYVPRVSDEEIVKGLRSCYRLRGLDLYTDAHTLLRDHGNIKPTLGCLEPLLAACRSLSEIKGSFDLVQSAISTVAASSFSQLQSIHLARSYFVTFPPPENWIGKTVGYLASLFQGACALTIESTICFEEAVTEEEEEYQHTMLNRRIQDKETFDAAVVAINKLKTHSDAVENP
jgi:hypothetical protein